jgi:starch phosphorylase
MDALRHSDYYMVAADFEDYFAAQRRVDQLWRSGYDWTRASILNTARMAWFSSDRTISEYAGDVWDVPVSNPADAGARKPE